MIVKWVFMSQVEELNDIFSVLGTSHFRIVNDEPPQRGDQICISSQRLFQSEALSGILSPKISR